jgi:arylformamidase
MPTESRRLSARGAAEPPKLAEAAKVEAAKVGGRPKWAGGQSGRKRPKLKRPKWAGGQSARVRSRNDYFLSMSSTLIDLSHTIEHGMITYQGLPAPVISDHLTREDSRAVYAAGTEFHIGKIEMVANTGTYLDSPFHRYAEGKDLAGLPLESLANLQGLVVRQVGGAERELERAMFPGLKSTADNLSGPEDRAISAAALEHLDVKGKAVLFHTAWDMRWRTEDYSNGSHPFLNQDAAAFLAEAGAALVGIDSYNIDSTADGRRPAHSILLAAGIPIVEHLCGLRQLPTSGFRFFAVPVKVKHFGTFPVRAFAIVLDD